MEWNNIGAAFNDRDAETTHTKKKIKEKERTNSVNLWRVIERQNDATLEILRIVSGQVHSYDHSQFQVITIIYRKSQKE